jgi:DNA-directed RNA polymerase subunit RPC12/RpoP
MITREELVARRWIKGPASRIHPEDYTKYFGNGTQARIIIRDDGSMKIDSVVFNLSPNVNLNQVETAFDILSDAEQTCAWEYIGAPGYFPTGCGEEFEMDMEGAGEMIFCPFCGGRIVKQGEL